MTDAKPDLIGLSQSEIYESLIANDLIEAKDKFRAKQIWHWLYNKGETNFEKMSSISKELRSSLPQFYQIKRPTIQTHEKSIDGTQKWLLKLKDGSLIETVFIPEDNRGTL
jgi:23S rRNA (adenine2503-C2)-methyltransferase